MGERGHVAISHVLPEKVRWMTERRGSGFERRPKEACYGPIICGGLGMARREYI